MRGGGARLDFGEDSVTVANNFVRVIHSKILSAPTRTQRLLLPRRRVSVFREDSAPVLNSFHSLSTRCPAVADKPDSTSLRHLVYQRLFSSPLVDQQRQKPRKLNRLGTLSLYVDQRGLEPPASSVQVRRSSQLSYWPTFLLLY